MKILFHSLTFLLGFSMLLSLTFLDRYSNYSTSNFFETSQFQERFCKYIERTAAYINYCENGYSSNSNNNLLSNLPGFYIRSQEELELTKGQTDFEFYHQKLNLEDTNFLYYVKNLNTGKEYYSPFFNSFSNPQQEKENFIQQITERSAYFILTTNNSWYSTNVNQYNYLNTDNLIWVLENLSNSNEKQSKTTKKINSNFVFYASVIPDFSHTQDDFYPMYKKFHQNTTIIHSCRFIFPLSLILFLVSFIFTIFYTGRKKGQKTIILNKFDYIYTEVAVMVTLIGILFSGFLSAIILNIIENFTYTLIGYYIALISTFYICLYPILSCAFYSLVRRIKAKTLFSHSLIYKIYTLHKNILYKLIFSIIIFFIVKEFSGLLLIYRPSLFGRYRLTIGIYLILSCIDYCWAAYMLFRICIDFYTLETETEKIAEGNLTNTIATKNFCLPIKQLGNYINKINEGLSTAIEERLKSERFKTELITNVSHDIKTPLTSIINYIDLLKKEKLDNPNAQKYLNILENKSWRLKTLIEDLVEVSKASSGTVNLNLEKLDIVQLLKQSLGEFEDHFLERELKSILTVQDEPIYLLVDGRNTFRIIENLLSNIYKYALKGTRIYIDISHDTTNVTISIKNISENKLNITTEELMERFVRGDISRNTEGSGLGLSIAKSLTTLQKGTLDIVLDGDLFKVILLFPIFK